MRPRGGAKNHTSVRAAAPGPSAVMSIYIPVQGSEESVEVHVDSLPENIDDLSDILQARLPNPPFTPLPRTLD